MNRERSQRLLIVAIVAVVLCHASLIVGLALAGEWRVWRFVSDFVAQLYGWVSLAWLAWRIGASSPSRRVPALWAQRI